LRCRPPASTSAHSQPARALGAFLGPLALVGLALELCGERALVGTLGLLRVAGPPLTLFDLDTLAWLSERWRDGDRDPKGRVGLQLERARARSLRLDARRRAAP
jgi:hypothetical protein